MLVPEFIRGKKILPTQLKKFTDAGKEILPNNIDIQQRIKKKESKERIMELIPSDRLFFIVDCILQNCEMENHMEKPITENPLSVNPTTENPKQINTNKTNTNKTNIKNSLPNGKESKAQTKAEIISVEIWPIAHRSLIEPSNMFRWINVRVRE